MFTGVREKTQYPMTTTDKNIRFYLKDVNLMSRSK